MKWLKLTAPKVHRKKRINKKILKKNGTWQSLRNIEKYLMEEWKKENIDDLILNGLEELAVFGQCSIRQNAYKWRMR